MVKGRDTRRWRMIKAAFREECAAEDLPCWICRQDIDYSITDWTDDEVFEPDHLYVLSEYPEYAEDPTNLRPSHRRCNRVRGNSMHLEGLGQTSKKWFV